MMSSGLKGWCAFVYVLLLFYLVESQNYDQVDSSALISGEKSGEAVTTTTQASAERSSSKEVAKEDYKTSKQSDNEPQSNEVNQSNLYSSSTASTPKSKSIELTSADWSSSSESSSSTAKYAETTPMPKTYTTKPSLATSQKPYAQRLQSSQNLDQKPRQRPYTGTKNPLNSKPQPVPDETYGSAPRIQPAFMRKPQTSQNRPNALAQQQVSSAKMPYKQGSTQRIIKGQTRRPNYQQDRLPQQNIAPSGYSKQNKASLSSTNYQQRPKTQSFYGQQNRRPNYRGQQSRLSAPGQSYNERPPQFNSNPVKQQNYGPQPQQSSQKYTWASAQQKGGRQSNSWATMQQGRRQNYQTKAPVGNYQGKQQNYRPISQQQNVRPQSSNYQERPQNVRPQSGNYQEKQQSYQQNVRPQSGNYQPRQQIHQQNVRPQSGNYQERPQNLRSQTGTQPYQQRPQPNRRIIDHGAMVLPQSNRRIIDHGAMILPEQQKRPYQVIQHGYGSASSTQKPSTKSNNAYGDEPIPSSN